MLETLINLVNVLIGIAVLASLIYVGFQLDATRKQMRVTALGNHINTRLSVWNNQLDSDLLRSANDKIFEHELYREDKSIHDLEPLSRAEKAALMLWYQIELLYFQSLHYQLQSGSIDKDQCLPLNYIACFNLAPIRWMWKNNSRSNGNWPLDFAAHVDRIVHIFDEIEIQMNEDEDAEWPELFAEYFEIDTPPDWVTVTETIARTL